jgi:hypothetical protein
MKKTCRRRCKASNGHYMPIKVDILIIPYQLT